MVHSLPRSWSPIFFTNGCQREMDQGGYGASSTYTMGWYGKNMGIIEESKVWPKKCLWGDLHNVFIGWSKVFLAMVMTRGILLCMVFVHGFWPILIIGFFGLFWREWGYVAINAQLSCIYEGRNNDVLDQFWWNLIVKVKMEGIMVGLWCIIMVWTIESYVDNFWC